MKDINHELTDTFVKKPGSKRRMDIFKSVAKKLGTGSALSEMNLEMHSTCDAIIPKKCMKDKDGRYPDDGYYVEVDLKDQLLDSHFCLNCRQEGTMYCLIFDKIPGIQSKAKGFGIRMLEYYTTLGLSVEDIVEKGD